MSDLTLNLTLSIFISSFTPAVKFTAKNLPFKELVSSLYVVDQLLKLCTSTAFTLSNIFESYLIVPSKAFIPFSPMFMSDTSTATVISSPGFNVAVPGVTDALNVFSAAYTFTPKIIIASINTVNIFVVFIFYFPP